MGSIGLDRIGRFKDFLGIVRNLSDMFEKADRRALEKALRSGDFKGACTALHVSENSLTTLLRQGATEASKIAKDDPEIAVTALRQQHPANGSRR